MADIPGDISTTATFDNPVYYGTSFGGDLEALSDIDFIRISLTAGTAYSFYAHVDTGTGGNAVFLLTDSSGSPITPAYSSGGVGLNAFFAYTPSTTATYYVAIAEFSGSTGQYGVDVTAIAATDHLLTTGDDTFTGTTANERILGGAGDDTITIGASLGALGEQGNDTITGNASANFISGGTGTDAIHGGGGNDSLFGDGGVDHVGGGAGADRIYGGDGGDYLFGGDFNTFTGDAGNNQLHGGSGNDGMAGSDGRDSLWGDDGNDILIGMALADKLDGGAGADLMYGGIGDDTYVVDNADDIVNEDPAAPDIPAGGVDTVLSSISFNLTADGSLVLGDIERLTLTGTADIDGTGNDLNNVLVGNAGANHLSGLGGRDIIGGGNGDDVIDGGLDRDLLTGGLGADTFVFTAIADSREGIGTRDLIQDFSSSQGDKLDLSAVDADSIAAGTQHFSFVGTAAFSHSPGELRLVVSGGDAYVYDDTNGDGKADFSLQLHGVTSLAASDFILS